MDPRALSAVHLVLFFVPSFFYSCLAAAPETSPAGHEEDTNASASSDLGLSRHFGARADEAIAPEDASFTDARRDPQSALHTVKPTLVLVSVDAEQAAETPNMGSVVQGSFSVERAGVESGTSPAERGKNDVRDHIDSCPGFWASEEATRTLHSKEVLRASRNERGGLKCEDGKPWAQSTASTTVNLLFPA